MFAAAQLKKGEFNIQEFSYCSLLGASGSSVTLLPIGFRES